MSAGVVTVTGPEGSATITVPDRPQATLERLAPSSLLINTNVRTSVDLEPLFVASIAEHGVQTPVVAHRDEHGQVVVDQGQRRTLAAVEAGVAEIPVYVHPYAPNDTDRIVEQLTENEHRAALGQPDLVAAVEQLALVGYTPAQIAKRVSIPKDTAAAAARVAKSKVAVEHLQTMTLEDAAVLVEFEDDAKAVATLTQQASWGRGLAAAAERIRQDYAERDAASAKRDELEAEGVTVVDQPGYDDKTILPLARIENADGTGVTEKQHAKKCPGHVVWVETGWDGDKRGPVVRAGCKNWKKHGHTDSYASNFGNRPGKADMTDEERETARLERRHVIESNKDWKASTTVRRKWLREFAQRKAAPSGAEQLIASAVTEGWANTSFASYSATMWDLAGLTPDGVAGELQAGAARGRALHLSLVVCLANWEAELQDDAWRYGDTRQTRAALVLLAISQWGHQLSAIEERVAEGTAQQAAV